MGFQSGGIELVGEPQVFSKIWYCEKAPSLAEWIVVPVFKKGLGSDCGTQGYKPNPDSVEADFVRHSS